MKTKIKKFVKQNWFIISIVILAIIKQCLITNIPITPYPNQTYDDDMMVEMAKSIRAGNWLGEYDSDVLVKGAMFPIILAIINYSGFSYINVMTFIYTISCIYFVYTIKDLFKNKKSLLIIYTILLFNPVSYAWWTLQRVYRNGITLAQVLFIIGSLFAMYQRKEKKITSMLPFAIIGGISLASLWLTREDGIWILPFVFVVMLIIFISIIIKYLKNRKGRLKETILKSIITLLPIIILVSAQNVNRTINYFKYGVFEYNEISDGYFGKVIHIIYSVKTDEDIKYVTATRKKINMLYEYSPTLNSIKDELEKSMDMWDYNDRTPGDTQVEDGWFWWSLKEAAESANIYKDAKTSNEFYKKIYGEIKNSIDDGKIETQFAMPSNLMSPWKVRYFIELPRAMARMSWYIVNFEDVITVNVAGDIPIDDIGTRKFEALTNDLAATREQDNSIDNATKYTEKYVERINLVGKMYKYLGLITTVIALLIYISITIEIIKKKNKETLVETWLLLTGIGCSLIVLIAGVSYNHITSCFSRYYMYLSGAYPLLLAFDSICIATLLEKFRKER